MISRFVQLLYLTLLPLLALRRDGGTAAGGRYLVFGNMPVSGRLAAITESVAYSSERDRGQNADWKSPSGSGV